MPAYKREVYLLAAIVTGIFMLNVVLQLEENLILCILGNTVPLIIAFVLVKLFGSRTIVLMVTVVGVWGAVGDVFVEVPEEIVCVVINFVGALLVLGLDAYWEECHSDT